MWSRTERGSWVILSCTTLRFVPLSTLILPVWSAMLRLPSVPWDTHRRTLVSVEPGWTTRPVMVRLYSPKGVTTSGGPLNAPFEPIG